MATAVVTVASGGRPVVDVTATSPTLGLAVTESASGMPVTKVAVYGMPVNYLVVATNGNKHPK
jgi:hypothetical protein